VIRESLLALVVLVDGWDFSKAHKEQRFAAIERFFRPEEAQVRWHGFFRLFNEPSNLYYAFASLRVHVALAFQTTRDALASFLIVLRLPPYVRAIVKEAEQ